jgi:uncharacterized membrane protein
MREGRVALALVGASLLLAAFLVSARSAVDEPAHLTAATAVVCGAHWRLENGVLRVEAPHWVAMLPSLEGADQAGPAAWTCARSRHVEHTAPYTPLAYLPQMVVLLVARALEATPLLALLWTRLVGVAVVLVALALALREFKDRAPLIAVLVAMPGVAGSLGAVSADGALVVATLALLGATCGAPPGGRARWTWLALLLWSVMLIGSSRVVFLPLCALVLLASDGFASRRARVLLCALGVFAWLAWGTVVAPQLRAHAAAIGVDVGANIERALHEPWDVITYIARELIGSGAWWFTFVGLVGPEQLKLQSWLYLFVLLTIAAAVLAVREPTRVPRPGLVVTGSVLVAALVFAAYAVAYRQGERAVNIVQGRHLLAPLLCLAAVLPPIPGVPPGARRVARVSTFVGLAAILALYWVDAAS